MYLEKNSPSVRLSLRRNLGASAATLTLTLTLKSSLKPSRQQHFLRAADGSSSAGGADDFGVQHLRHGGGRHF